MEKKRGRGCDPLSATQTIASKLGSIAIARSIVAIIVPVLPGLATTVGVLLLALPRAALVPLAAGIVLLILVVIHSYLSLKLPRRKA